MNINAANMSAIQQQVPVTINVRDVVRAPVRYEAYNATASRALAGLQIGLGIWSIVFNIGAIVIGQNSSIIGYGIWLPIFWSIAGGFGIGASFRKSLCTILTTMIMSILCAVFNIVYIFFTVIVLININKWTHDPRAQYWVSSMMLLIGVAEIVVAIIASVVCCRVVCCGNRQTNAGEQTGFQYLNLSTPQGPQTVTLPSGYQVAPQVLGAQAMAQPIGQAEPAVISAKDLDIQIAGNAQNPPPYQTFN